LDPDSVSTKQKRIAKLAKDHPTMAITTLAHHIDYEWMEQAYNRTPKDRAAGIDKQTAKEYAVNLKQNLESLVERIKSGTYRAPPVRRHYIEKADGSQRALGIPTFEDKVAQRAICMLLEPIYGNDFHDCSYGYRRGISAQDALQAVRNGITYNGGRWGLDADIRKFFDSIDHTKLREFLARRVTDGVVRKMIDKWLKAGVLEEGLLTIPDEGTPQGGVISPLLANIFLHYVLDEWFGSEVQPRLRGPSTLVRFADDFVMLFAYKDDAERVLNVLGKRLEKYGLELHPDKTCMVDFRYRAKALPVTDEQLATTFNFLGFTHIWVKSRRGRTIVRQITAKERFLRAKKEIDLQCRKMMHKPVRDQWKKLSRMLLGHFNYYGVTGNWKRLASLRYQAERSWRKWLARRSNGGLPWHAFKGILERFSLPPVRIVRSYVKT
jgi:RNA-directed DNA polymerase